MVTPNDKGKQPAEDSFSLSLPVLPATDEHQVSLKNKLQKMLHGHMEELLGSPGSDTNPNNIKPEDLFTHPRIRQLVGSYQKQMKGVAATSVQIILAVAVVVDEGKQGATDKISTPSPVLLAADEIQTYLNGKLQEILSEHMETQLGSPNSHTSSDNVNLEDLLASPRVRQLMDILYLQMKGVREIFSKIDLVAPVVARELKPER